MKIIHVIEKIEKAAGTTTFCVRAAEELSKLGHEVCILIKKENTLCDAVPGFGVEVIKYDVGLPLPFEPDVVHIHGIWPPWQHRVQRFFESKGYPIVLSPHGMLAPWAMAHKRWKKFIPWCVYQKADVGRVKLLFSTAAKETIWIRDLGFEMPIIEVPLGTDIDSNGMIALHDAPVKFLSFVGRIYPVKGLDLLFRAWAKFKAINSDWHLFLVGPDQAGFMGELEKLASTLGLSVRHGGVDGVGDCDITFAGPLYGEDKTMSLLKSRGLVLPSYTENFGGVVIDALALALPVLASTATPWEVLEECDCGWQFDLNEDSLCQSLLRFVSKTDDERVQMGERGRKLVEEKYTWSAVVKRMVEGYREISKMRSKARRYGRRGAKSDFSFCLQLINNNGKIQEIQH